MAYRPIARRISNSGMPQRRCSARTARWSTRREASRSPRRGSGQKKLDNTPETQYTDLVGALGAPIARDQTVDSRGF